ncbi:hypothetical protein [Streptomyces sp. NBC_00343]|uniref:hypothetical protein n=1 Tax=Streptomyces sp. NBC_00343 TaxID=2975719 RepID=UPI002E29141C|nr:hypothetical protein [Streptomyces sp. NBC_00343]
MDLQEFPEDLDVVNAIRDLLLSDPSAVQECRLAWALLDGPVQGIRALSIASGLHQEQVWEITSSHDGGLSPLGLVRTVERGTSWSSEGREKGSYALADTARLPHTKKTLYKNPPTPQGGEGSKDQTIYRVRFASGIELLDPELDVWRRSKDELGSEGWRVAVITGLAPVAMTMAEWAELLQVSTAQARKLAGKFEKHGVATRTKQGRSVSMSLDWTPLIHVVQEDRELLLTRAKHLQNEHAEEQRRIQRPLSFEEIEVRRRGKNPAQYAVYLQDAPSDDETPGEARERMRLLHHLAGATEADWRRWFELDEEPEPGIVPDTPEVLVEQVAESGKLGRPAQESLESAVVTPELLAEMRKRVIAGSR